MGKTVIRRLGDPVNVSIETLGAEPGFLLTVMGGNPSMIDRIDRSEIGRRDRVLRAYFEGRTWDVNAEFGLKRELVLKSYHLLPEYPFLIDNEWEVSPNMSQGGRGDLIFADGFGQFAVVEVKWLNLNSTGSTACARRTQKRKEAKEQAVRYRNILASQLPQARKVEGYYFTNEYRDRVIKV